MPLDPKSRKTWEEVQKKFDYPVNAIGVRINNNDRQTLAVWKAEGIDKFLKR